MLLQYHSPTYAGNNTEIARICKHRCIQKVNYLYANKNLNDMQLHNKFIDRPYHP